MKKTKTCIITDWKGKEKKVKVPYLTRKVTIRVISGDMVMIKPVYADSGKDRNEDFIDSQYVVTLKNCEQNEKGEYFIE